MNLNELTLDNAGSWPIVVKIVVVVVLFVSIGVLGSFLLIKPQLAQLAKKRIEQTELQTVYEGKVQQAVLLPLYKKQIKQMQSLFQSMLDQLPSSAEIPNLVEDISKMGIAHGLEFDLIRPEKEEKKEFYIELPITMIVAGDYPQLAEFISNLSNLQRIVTVGDFTVEKKASDKDKESDNAQQKVRPLTMQMTASTYRYMEAPKEKIIADDKSHE